MLCAPADLRDPEFAASMALVVAALEARLFLQTTVSLCELSATRPTDGLQAGMMHQSCRLGRPPPTSAVTSLTARRVVRQKQPAGILQAARFLDVKDGGAPG